MRRTGFAQNRDDKKVEDSIVRLIKWTIVVVLINALSGNAAGQTDINDISAYYGFGQMEIVKLDWDIMCLRIADFNGDGQNDIAVINNRRAKIELLIQKEAIGPSEPEVAVQANDVDINALKAESRFDRQSVAVSQKIASLVCGDLNSDGMIDLAFYADDPKGLYVILQKASELKSAKPSMLSWRRKEKIKIDDGLLNPNALVCADLNNDGANDLVLACQDGVYIILQKEDGTLAEAVKYPTTASILGVEVGDLNGDNVNDLILITNGSEKPVHVRFGLKTGQLGPQVDFFIEAPSALELAKIDLSAGDEILTTDKISGRLICYKFTAGAGTDTDWPIYFYPLALGEASTKRDLVVDDFDSDGLADVVISNPAAAEVIFYKQIASLGLAEPVRFPALSDIASLSAADVDGDGMPELGVLSVKEKVIGLSKFKDGRLSFPKPLDLIGEPVAMELADMDGDGSTDCLYISRDANDVRSMRVISSLAASDKEIQTTSQTLEAGETTPVLKLEKLTSNPDGLKVIDVDQDRLDDVLIFAQYELPILVRQTMARKFEVVNSPDAQMSLIEEASLRSTAVADTDGKAGKELLIAQKNFARSVVFADGQRWTVLDQYNAKSTENNISTVAAFAVDGEAQAAKTAILLLDGQKGQLQLLKAGDDGTYRFEKEVDVGQWNPSTHLKMLFEELCGSGTKSILLFDGNKFALITPPGSGNMPGHLEQQFNYETKIKDGRYGRVTTGDINSDDKIDIIMVEYENNHIEILTLDSRNKPIPAMRFKIFEQKKYIDKKFISDIEPRELKVADVTGDGKNDLVIVIHDRIIVYPQD
jgi:hypothetical protein